MSQQKITKLTPEQEALIPVYREKWRAIALSTERIDREKAAEAVKAAYAAIHKQEPEIIFCDSPYAAWKFVIQKNLKNRLDIELESQLLFQVGSQINSQVCWELNNEVASKMQLVSSLWMQAVGQLKERLKSELKSRFQLSNTKKLRDVWVIPELWMCGGSCLDFYFSVLNCACDQKKWSVYQLLLKDCGWILPFEKICILCVSEAPPKEVRPTKLSFDNENRLHAEGEPAISFADGYSLYSYHGVTLPEKYGKLHPKEWQAKWLLEETNAELRRVLIQGIGYSRICQDLQAIELDCWQEYTLLKIDSNIDIEAIYLLKMTCPSTGFIHALRVPPDMNCARDAICWVNWGIDPEEFSVQT